MRVRTLDRPGRQCRAHVGIGCTYLCRVGLFLRCLSIILMPERSSYLNKLFYEISRLTICYGQLCRPMRIANRPNEGAEVFPIYMRTSPDSYLSGGNLLEVLSEKKSKQTE